MVAGSSPDDVRNGEGRQPRRRGGGNEPPALDRRQMLTHRIDLADIGARREQGAGHGLLVGQRQAGRRQAEQGGGAAGQQEQEPIVRPGRACQRQNLSCSVFTGPVRHRVGGLDHADRPARHGMAVARDNQPFEGAVRPGFLDRSGHGGRGLAGTENDGPAGRARAGFRFQVRQRYGKAALGPGDGNRFVQQAAQQCGWIGSRCGHGICRNPLTAPRRRRMPPLSLRLSRKAFALPSFEKGNAFATNTGSVAKTYRRTCCTSLDTALTRLLGMRGEL